MSQSPSFRPAKPWGWVIWAVQTFLRFDLAWRNRLHLEPRDLEVLRDLPRGAGIILAANHADETDFKACLGKIIMQVSDRNRLSGICFLPNDLDRRDHDVTAHHSPQESVEPP